ncbi:unnamed protein product [Brassica oleracea]
MRPDQVFRECIMEIQINETNKCWDGDGDRCKCNPWEEVMLKKRKANPTFHSQGSSHHHHHPHVRFFFSCN